eukprot:TRINITY_DN73_c0_g4_i1.p1 TRINITY_DN73_c0_g4~~TRINITY_DN73_c0_g4_i1.p1  ORF type:complete len:414 (+),score=277.42 TRINITY_DN73_c0_g4_i1:188-1429(+)
MAAQNTLQTGTSVPWALEQLPPHSDEEANSSLVGLPLYAFQRTGDARIVCVAATDLEQGLYARYPDLKKCIAARLKTCGRDKAYFKCKPFENRDAFRRCFSNNATNGKCLVPRDMVQAAIDELELTSAARRESIAAFVSRLKASERAWVLAELTGASDAAASAAVGIGAPCDASPTVSTDDDDYEHHKRKRAAAQSAYTYPAPLAFAPLEMPPPLMTSSLAFGREPLDCDDCELDAGTDTLLAQEAALRRLRLDASHAIAQPARASVPANMRLPAWRPQPSSPPRTASVGVVDSAPMTAFGELLGRDGSLLFGLRRPWGDDSKPSVDPRDLHPTVKKSTRRAPTAPTALSTPSFACVPDPFVDTVLDAAAPPMLADGSMAAAAAAAAAVTTASSVKRGVQFVRAAARRGRGGF